MNTRENFLKERLANKQEELEAVKEQLPQTLSKQDEVKLNRQAESLLQEIEEIGAEIQALQTNLDTQEGNKSDNAHNDSSRNLNISGGTVNASGAGALSSGNINGVVANAINQLSSSQQSIFGGNISVGGSINVGNITQISNSGTTNQPIASQENLPPKRTILVLASSPVDLARLRLDQEVREIDEGLRRSQKRSHFDLQQKWAVRTDDLRRALLDYNPQIVHFAGHGTGEQGLVLENQLGVAQLVKTDALADLFSMFTESGLECVVLNACYAEIQAEAIARHVKYVIGMKSEVSDVAAIKFVTGFYDALGAGWTYERAFEMGRNAIALEGLPEDMIPVFKSKML